jgi:hypothetical protein
LPALLPFRHFRRAARAGWQHRLCCLARIQCHKNGCS